MASDIHNNYCIVCSSDILYTENFYLDKLEANFVLKILLQIPQDSQLISQIQSSLTFLPVCKPCGSVVKQCKEIYTEMMANVHTFWAFQNSILQKLHKSSDKYTHKLNKFNDWVTQCINFVKNQNFQPFRYPFVVQDLTKLLTLTEPRPISDHFTNSTGVAAEHFPEQNKQFGHPHRPTSYTIPIINDPLEVTPPTIIDISETFQYKHEDKLIEFENEDDEDSDKNYDISDPELSSEEDATPSLPDFHWNPVTGKFTCVEPSCSKTTALKRMIENHFRNEHSSSLVKKTFACDWPSCGKTFKKRSNHQSHLDKHRGTPSIICGKCGKSFYYTRGLRIHQNRSCEMETCTKLNNVDQYSISNLKVKRSVRNFRTGKYHCNYPLCVESSLSREEIRQHVIMHERLQGKHFPQNSNPISSIPATVTRKVSSPTVQNIEQFNYFEENSPDPLDNLPSSSESSSLIILNGKPDTQFENEDDEDYELSEKASSSEEDNNYFQSSKSKISKSTSFPCKWPNCGKVFARQLNYKSHMNVHKGTPGFKCKKCGKSFYWKRKINSHNCQPRDQIASTSILNLRTMVNNFRDEEDLDGVLCTWPGCGMRLANKTRLSDHMDKHRGTPRQRCEQCGQLFFWRADLLKHRRREHGNKGDKAENLEQSDGNSEDRILNQISTSCSSDNSTIYRDPISGKISM